MADNKDNSYSHILKYTGIFGGVQGLNILVGVVRNKFAALFLGPSGMGLLSLFNSTVNLISSSTNLGIPTTGVKMVSEKYEESGREVVDESTMPTDTRQAGRALPRCHSRPTANRWALTPRERTKPRTTS